MIQYFLDHPYFIAIFFAVLAFTIWLCWKATVASKKRYGANAKLMAKIKEENELMYEFAVLTESLIASAQPEKLFKGTALNLQKRVAKKADLMAEFNALSEEQKEIYALYSVIDDGAMALSDFFRNSTHPLTDYAKSAVKNILDSKAAAVFSKEFNAFDDDNESVSVIPAEISRLDSEFASLAPVSEICEKAGRYIKENAEKFI